MVHGNQGKELLGATILLLVVDGRRGPNGWSTKYDLEHGGGPGPAPGLAIKTGGVGMVTRHHGSNDETDRYTTAEPGSHRTVKWCLSQMCPDYDIWIEEGREAKGPLRDRRDHGFDCGLGLAVITMTHHRVFDTARTRKIEWIQGSQQRTC